MAQFCPQPAALSVDEFCSNVKAVQMIDEEIESYQEKIRALRTRRNTLVLIAQLPPELLLMIFQFLQALHSHELYSSLNRRKWITLSHVCTHWRRVSLESPNLWSHIDIDSHTGSHNWVKLFLGRSRMTLLTLSAMITPISHDLVRAPLTNMGRMRQLLLYPESEVGESLLDILETHQAPLLERFEMNYTLMADSNRLPDRLFAGHHPSLRKLSLVHCNFSWNLPPLENLEHLEIRALPNLGPSLFQLASILRNTPNLEQLNVIGTNPPPPPGTDIGPIIILPRLSRIDLEAGICQCIKLLGHISYPATSSTYVYSLRDAGYTSTNIFELMGCIFSPDRPIGVRPPIQYLRISALSSRPKLIEAWHDSGSYEDAVDPPIRLRVGIPTNAEDPWDGPSLNILWNVLALEGLECLDIIGFDIQKSVWMDICGRLDRLKLLKITLSWNIGSTNILEVLSSARPGVQAQARTLYFPALRGLMIAEWDFDTFEKDGKQTSKPLEQLIACLKTREKFGAGIERVDIQGCYFLFESGVRELAKVVPHITWNEWEEDT